MISVFRKIRQTMVKEKKVRNYILYALGEILLVMIGILLALQVNNYNEKRKLKSSINNTLRNISYDLETDTTFASNIIKFYEDNQKYSQKIIKGEINMDNYKTCPECVSLVTVYRPFNIQTKGFDQLNTLVDNGNSEKDSLITDLTKFYSAFKPVIAKNNDRMEGIVMKNFNDFEQFPWFLDMAQGKFTEEMIKYFVESEDYKKRVASHAMLAVGNHLGAAKQYKLNAIHLLERINKRLDKKEIVEKKKDSTPENSSN